MCAGWRWAACHLALHNADWGIMLDLDHTTIRILAAMDRETRGADEEEGEWQGSSDSNRGPSVLETDALTS